MRHGGIHRLVVAVNGLVRVLAFLLLFVPCFLCFVLLSCGCPEGSIQVSTFSTSTCKSNGDTNDDDTNRFVNAVQRRTWQKTWRVSRKKGRNHATPSSSSSTDYPTSTTLTIEELRRRTRSRSGWSYPNRLKESWNKNRQPTWMDGWMDGWSSIYSFLIHSGKRQRLRLPHLLGMSYLDRLRA
jgi:hypothetical protein